MMPGPKSAGDSRRVIHSHVVADQHLGEGPPVGLHHARASAIRRREETEGVHPVALLGLAVVDVTVVDHPRLFGRHLRAVAADLRDR